MKIVLNHGYKLVNYVPIADLTLVNFLSLTPKKKRKLKKKYKFLLKTLNLFHFSYKKFLHK